tara:strand:- start:234 stop:449 length:216 start_codon:yes stop_codon:yes gene_type:complete
MDELAKDHRLVLKYIRDDGCDLMAEAEMLDDGVSVRAIVSRGISTEDAHIIIERWVSTLDGARDFIEAFED